MSFSESSLNKKLAELNNTQQSVQTLSLWLIHHRKHARLVVATWLRELMATSRPERKLTLVYLANDILQNSRKKGDEYTLEFADGHTLARAFEATAKSSDDKQRFTLERILNIWKDRRILADDKIAELKRKLHAADHIDSTKYVYYIYHHLLVELRIVRNNERCFLSVEHRSAMGTRAAENDVKKRRTAAAAAAAAGGGAVDTPSPSINDKKTSAAPASLSLRDEVRKELAESGSLKVPDTAELIALLHELEKSASSDAVVREKIAELPSRVTDVAELAKLKSAAEAGELSATVSDALHLLDNYNVRLQQELSARKSTALLLAVYAREQQRELDAERKLIDEWQRKLAQVMQLKQELHVHLDSLPDLSAAQLLPLPSAGDLFSSNGNNSSSNI